MDDTSRTDPGAEPSQPVGGGSEPPPPPRVAPSVLAVTTHEGRRHRLGYVGGFGDDYVAPSTGDYGILAGGDQRRIGRGRRPGLVSASGVNRVRAECRGAKDGAPAKLRLTVNDVLVLERTDPDGHADFLGVGLSVYSPEGGTVGLFDNAKAEEL